jgi:hypothetical protein
MSPIHFCVEGPTVEQAYREALHIAALLREEITPEEKDA